MQNFLLIAVVAAAVAADVGLLVADIAFMANSYTIQITRKKKYGLRVHNTIYVEQHYYLVVARNINTHEKK